MPQTPSNGSIKIKYFNTNSYTYISMKKNSLLPSTADEISK